MHYGDFLVHAGSLLGPPGPTEADARRATSAAYYAVFHALTTALAAWFPQHLGPLAARLPDHNAVKAVSVEVLSQKKLPKRVGADNCPDVLLELADNVVRLQEARNKADYDLARPFDPALANECFARAEKAIQCLTDARKRCPRELDSMLYALIARNR